MFHFLDSLIWIKKRLSILKSNKRKEKYFSKVEEPSIKGTYANMSKSDNDSEDFIKQSVDHAIWKTFENDFLTCREKENELQFLQFEIRKRVSGELFDLFNNIIKKADYEISETANNFPKKYYMGIWLLDILGRYQRKMIRELGGVLDVYLTSIECRVIQYRVFYQDLKFCFFMGPGVYCVSLKDKRSLFVELMGWQVVYSLITDCYGVTVGAKNNK